MTDQNPLTPRERDVVRLIVEARTNGEIADHLKLPVDSIKTYIKQICAKLDARNRVDIAVKSLQLRLVDLDELPDPRPRGLQKLTKREEEVLALLQQGLLAWAVGERLGLTKRYVLYVEQVIRRKWHVNSREEILALARAYAELPAGRGPNERPGTGPGESPEGRRRQ